MHVFYILLIFWLHWYTGVNSASCRCQMICGKLKKTHLNEMKWDADHDLWHLCRRGAKVNESSLQGPHTCVCVFTHLHTPTHTTEKRPTFCGETQFCLLKVLTSGHSSTMTTEADWLSLSGPHWPWIVEKWRRCTAGCERECNKTKWEKKGFVNRRTGADQDKDRQREGVILGYLAWSLL